MAIFALCFCIFAISIMLLAMWADGSLPWWQGKKQGPPRKVDEQDIFDPFFDPLAKLKEKMDHPTEGTPANLIDSEFLFDYLLAEAGEPDKWEKQEGMFFDSFKHYSGITLCHYKVSSGVNNCSRTEVKFKETSILTDTRHNTRIYEILMSSYAERARQKVNRQLSKLILDCEPPAQDNFNMCSGVYAPPRPTFPENQLIKEGGW